MVSGSRCGVLGDPIEHSLSPVLHRAGYRAVGLDWSYDAHRVTSGGLPDFLAERDEALRGLSLTMPLKREALGLVDRVSSTARAAGAVNTVLFEPDGSISGDNTDLPGAVAAIRERWSGPLRSATILGGGATATSVGLALCDMGVTEIRVLVRTPERATETVESLQAHPSAPHVQVGLLGEPEGEVGDIVVSTIPADAQTSALVEAVASAPCLFDVIYDPWPTPLASAASGTVVSGLDLLVHQAALQFTLFTGLGAPLEQMRAAGEQALAERHRPGATA
nr:shikimate dehydrogenase [Nocardioides gilvus]